MTNLNIKAGVLNRSVLKKYKFGFAGEAYIEASLFEEEYRLYMPVLGKYFSLKRPFYCNRNSAYYSKDSVETLNMVNSLLLDIPLILHSDMLYDKKQFVIFSLTEHMVSCIAKIIGIVFSYNSLKDSYYEPLKGYLLELTDYLVRVIFDEDLYEFPQLSEEFLELIRTDMKELNITEVREYSEMDNVLVMVITYFALYDYIGNNDLIISPLQGAALLPPFYISMSGYINAVKRDVRKVNYEYVRFSRYDKSHYCEMPLFEQTCQLSTKYLNAENVILIDDNTGTALTIKTIKQELSKYFANITTCALEYYWEAKIYKADTYSAFKLDDIDLITPLCYRHFTILDEQIEYIKHADKIHSRYKEGAFNKLNMIYQEIDYTQYILQSNIEESYKTRILDIYERFKALEKIIFC